MVAASLRALLARVIDYAGLFPPARLPLDRAIHAFETYREQPESWLLGRFILPAARLGDLDTFADRLRAGRLWTFSCLGRGGGTSAELLQGLSNDLRDIATIRERFVEAVEIDVLEIRLPGDVIGKGIDPAATLVAEAAAMIEASGPPVLKPFYEIPLRNAWREEVIEILDALVLEAKRGSPSRRRCQPPGFKLRTGGLEAEAFPSVEQVAFVLASAAARRVPLKFTAGLHHPVRRFDPGVQATMHGFLNLFVAGNLGSNEDMVRQVVAQEDPTAFRFDDRELACGPFRVPLAQVNLARRDAVLSFGSCSFDEPRDDLRAMGLI